MASLFQANGHKLKDVHELVNTRTNHRDWYKFDNPAFRNPTKRRMAVPARGCSDHVWGLGSVVWGLGFGVWVLGFGV